MTAPPVSLWERDHLYDWPMPDWQPLPPGHDIAILFSVPVSSSAEAVQWFRDEAESALPAFMALHPADAEVNPFDDWKRAPIKLWRMNYGLDGQLRHGTPAAIEKVRWSMCAPGC